MNESRIVVCGVTCAAVCGAGCFACIGDSAIVIVDAVTGGTALTANAHL